MQTTVRPADLMSSRAAGSPSRGAEHRRADPIRYAVRFQGAIPLSAVTPPTSPSPCWLSHVLDSFEQCLATRARRSAALDRAARRVWSHDVGYARYIAVGFRIRWSSRASRPAASSRIVLFPTATRRPDRLRL